jgi:hypothetical protein
LHEFSERLARDTSLGLHLRSLFLWKDEFGESDDWDELPPIEEDNKAILNIISRAPQLHRVYGADLQNNTNSLLYLFGGVSRMSWEAFCLMATTAGPSLTEFENVSIYDAVDVYSPRPLYSFIVLRSLFWDCDSKFNVDDGVVLENCFPCLESLWISSCSHSFLELLTRIE